MLTLDRARTLVASISVAFLCSIAPLCAQTTSRGDKCALNVAQSPQIRGLRLGMSVDDAARILPMIRDRGLTDRDLNPDDLDNIYVSFIPPDGSLHLEDINWVGLGFVDNRLYHFSLGYSLSFPTIDAFASKISETLILPATWEKTGDLRVLRCDGFFIYVHDAAKPMLSVMDTSAARLVGSRALLPAEQRLAEKKERARRRAEAEIVERKHKAEAEEEKKRKTFRP